MAFHSKPGATLDIEGKIYRIAEHPQAPGMPYGQEGRRAVVYQLLGESDEKYALKVFKSRFRIARMVRVAELLEPYASLDGLQACQRIVLTGSRHPKLLKEYPDLTYAVLMSWVEGPTWQEILLDTEDFSQERSLGVARAFSSQLMALEENGLAHCDLSGANLIIQPGDKPGLVDLEEMYGPGFLKPNELPAGSPGYAHRSAPHGIWAEESDLFSGAVLLSEMLSWSDPEVREAAWGESYFAPKDMQNENQRLDMLRKSIDTHYGKRILELFNQVWRSDSLRDCPTFAEWAVALPEKIREQKIATKPLLQANEIVPENGDALSYYLDGQAAAEEGKLDRALDLYRKAIALAPPSLGKKIEERMKLLDDRTREGDLSKQPAPTVKESGGKYPTRECPACGKTIPVGQEICPHCEGLSREEGKQRPSVKQEPAAARDTSGPTKWKQWGIWIGIGGIFVAVLAVILYRGGTPNRMRMMYIPAGEFLMGSDEGRSNEQPVHEVYLDAFWMDEHEVTNAQYAEFLNDQGNQEERGVIWLDAGDSDVRVEESSGEWIPPNDYEDHPVTEVTWYGARAYCDWAGKRLPTEAEWEKAARGGLEGKKYPWGDEDPVCSQGAENGAQYSSCDGNAIPVMSFSPNGYGLYDMAGNLWEWVSDYYDSSYYEHSPAENPQGAFFGDLRVLRGGSWFYFNVSVRAAYRYGYGPNLTNSNVGFRCAASE